MVFSQLKCAAAGELVVGLAHQVLHLELAAFETVAVMVADDVGDGGLLNRPLDAHEMIETLVPLGMLGGLPARQHQYELVGDAD